MYIWRERNHNESAKENVGPSLKKMLDDGDFFSLTL